MNPEELIEKYIEGKLSKEEENIFNTLLETDSDFRKEVVFHMDLKKVIEKEEDISFKKTLQRFDTGISKSGYTKWLVAASIALLFTFSILYFSSTPSNQDLFAQNFEPYRNIVQPITRGKIEDDIKTKAFIAYENNDFAKAIEHFLQLQETAPEPYLNFYVANSHLALNNTKQAIEFFNKYLSVKDSVFLDKTQWYLALAYLQENNVEESKKRLQNIISSKSYNYQKAKKLLEKLK